MTEATTKENGSDGGSDHESDSGPWRAFADGFLRPSIVGTFGAFAVALVQLIVCCVLVTPETIARTHPGYLLNNPYDIFTHATCRIHQMRYTEPRELGVLLVGSSTLREAMLDDRQVADALTESMGVPVDFFRVTSGWQSLWETVAIVDYLPEGFRGVVIIGIDPGRVSRPREILERWLETPLLAIDSPNLREEIRLAGLEPPTRTGVFLLDQSRFFSARKGVVFRLVGGPIEPQMHFTHLLKSWSEEKWELAERRDLPQWVEAFDRDGPANLAILGRLIRRLQADGNRVVLLETPLHPRARRACGAKYDEYLLKMRRFADDQGVAFWCLDQEAQITEEDFVDFIHLCTHTAQLRYQTVLMNKIEPELRRVERSPR